MEILGICDNVFSEYLHLHPDLYDIPNKSLTFYQCLGHCRSVVFLNFLITIRLCRFLSVSPIQKIVDLTIKIRYDVLTCLFKIFLKPFHYLQRTLPPTI